MSLAVIFVVVALAIIIRDRKDWFGYVFIIVGSIYIGTMPIGPKLTGWLNGLATWLDTFVRGLLQIS